MKRYFLELKVVLLLAALNSGFWLSLSHVMPELVTNIIFNAVRTALVFWAGWHVIATLTGGLWGAALAGALVLLVDHPIVTGAYFLVSGEPMAFGGVLISFFMFVWVAMLIGWLGGLACSKWARSNA